MDPDYEDNVYREGVRGLGEGMYDGNGVRVHLKCVAECPWASLQSKLGMTRSMIRLHIDVEYRFYSETCFAHLAPVLIPCKLV